VLRRVCRRRRQRADEGVAAVGSFSPRSSKRWLVDLFFARELHLATSRIRGLTVDVGGGGRRYVHFICPQRYFGIDLQVPADIVADGRALPLGSDSVDTVLCFQMLAEVPEPMAVLSEISRVLKPHGNLLLSADQSRGVHNKPHDYFRYTRYGLQHLISQSGLHVDNIRPLGGGWALGVNRMVYRLHEAFARHAALRPLVAAIGAVALYAGAVLDDVDWRPDDTQGHFVCAVKLPRPGADH